MAIKIRYGRSFAVIDGYHWSSDWKELEYMLNASLPPDGPSGDDPHPDYTTALKAIGEIGGEIVEHDDFPDVESDTVY
jgi:hypothetical protein